LGLSVQGSWLHRRPSDLEPSGEFDESVVVSKRGPSPVEGESYTLGGRLTFVPSRSHELRLDVDRARQVYDNSEGQLGTLDRPDASPPLFRGYGPKQRFHRDQAALSYSWLFGSGQLQASLMRNTMETLGRTIPEGTPGGPPGSGAPDKPAGSPPVLEPSDTVFDGKLVHHAASHRVTVGGQFWDARMVDGVALAPFEFTQWSLFIEDEWRLLSPLALTVGVRRDDHSAFGGHISPRAYLVWNATPQWT